MLYAPVYTNTVIISLAFCQYYLYSIIIIFLFQLCSTTLCPYVWRRSRRNQSVQYKLHGQKLQSKKERKVWRGASSQPCSRLENTLLDVPPSESSVENLDTMTARWDLLLRVAKCNCYNCQLLAANGWHKLKVFNFCSSLPFCTNIMH